MAAIANTSKQDENNHAPIFDIAKWVIGFSFTVIGVLGFASILVIGFSEDSAKVTAIKDILSILLPVLGAWAGTVIAYYFSRENFESATKSTSNLVKKLTPDQILESVLTKDAMIPIESASRMDLTKDESQFFLKPDVIDAIMNKNKRNRLPVLDKEGKIKYMLHRSVIDQFIVKAISQGKKLEQISLQDLVDDDEFKKIASESFRILSQDSNLAEAKAIIDRVAGCSDVFITENGTKDTPVIGWITNAIILSRARL